MKYKKIKPEKAQEVLLANGIPAIIETDETSIKAIRITAGDTHVKVAVGSYSVDLFIPEAKELTQVTVDFGSDAGLPSGIKTFESEEAADAWIKGLRDKYETVDSDWKIEKKQVFKREPDTFIITEKDAQAIKAAGNGPDLLQI